MKKLFTTLAALTVFCATPALAASSNSGGTSRSGTSGSGINPGAWTGASGSGIGATAPNTGPGGLPNNRTRYAPTAPPVPGSAQDPYGNSVSGGGSGTTGSGTRTTR